MKDASSPRLASEETKEQVMVQAAKLYYELGRNQAEIADQLGLTRWQISRLLKEARDVGIVRIEIAPRSARLPAVESALQDRFQLREAIVVQVRVNEPSIVRDDVAQAAASYLRHLRPSPSLLGVSWGRTMSAVARWLPVDWADATDVVLLNGATSRYASGDRPNNVAERIASAAHGQATILPVPAIVGQRETREAIERDPVISDILALARKAEVAMFSLGALTHGSVLVESGFLSPADVDALGAQGAVGDILGRFVGPTGEPVDASTDARTIGIHLRDLKSIETTIAVAGGQDKVGVIQAALAAGYVDVLVTDATTAHTVLGRTA